MNILVLSHQHTLLPFAYKLQQESHDVQTLVYKSGAHARYEGAYKGVLKLAFHKGDSGKDEILQAFKELAAENAQIIVITNNTSAMKDFTDARNLYGMIRTEEQPYGVLRIGAWFDGANFSAPHILIADEGVVFRGQGSRTDSAMTLVRLDSFDNRLAELISPEADRLRVRGFKGLSQWGVSLQPDGEITLSHGTISGWPSLHAHAFISVVDDFGDVLSGQPPVLRDKFTMSLAVSRPPWPERPMTYAKPTTIGGLTDDQISQVFWHDAQADQSNRELSTAGLDGLVGVVHGSAQSFELAQGRVVRIAQTMDFQDKQFRQGAGEQVREVLAVLEETFGVVV